MKEKKSILIQVRLPRELVEEIDKLIEEGHYSSRTSFFEDAARRRLEELSMVRNEIALLVKDYLNGKAEKVNEKLSIDINLEEAKRRLRELGLEDVMRALDKIRGRVK